MLKTIVEAFENRRKEKGVVPFKTTDINSAHIKKILDTVSKTLGVPLPTLHKHIDDTMQEIAELEKVSPILYSTIARNQIESAVFDILKDERPAKLADHLDAMAKAQAGGAEGDKKADGEKTDAKADEAKSDEENKVGKGKIHSIFKSTVPIHGKGPLPVPGAPKYSLRTLLELVRRIQDEHKQFFPLHNFHDDKVLFSPNIHPLPDAKLEKKDPGLKQIKTAAASSDGQFYFYVPFIQQLLDWGHLVDVKAKGKKYQSNGGEIPDPWAYVEFVIIHEFMHYTYGDSYYQKKLKANPTIINWVGDFRSNYLLVKSGFEQLPIGLFSDDVNYDRQKSYKEMYDLVKAEFDKLNKHQQDMVTKILDGMSSDSHVHSDADVDDDAWDKIDKNARNVEGRISNAAAGSGAKPKPAEGQSSRSAGKAGQNQSTGGSNTDQEFDWSKVTPTYSWTQLLSKFTKVSATPEESYAKANKKMASSLHTARQLGAAVVKPGEIAAESVVKLAIVVDSSGSMLEILPRVYAELRRLLRDPEVSATFVLIKYSDEHKVWLCNMRKNTAVFTTVPDLRPGSPDGTAEGLFKRSLNGGTNFSDACCKDALELIKKKFGVIIISDADILWSNNFENLKKVLVAGGQNIGIIFSDRATFTNFAKSYKSVPKNASFFSGGNK